MTRAVGCRFGVVTISLLEHCFTLTVRASGDQAGTEPPNAQTRSLARSQ